LWNISKGLLGLIFGRLLVGRRRLLYSMIIFFAHQVWYLYISSWGVFCRLLSIFFRECPNDGLYEICRDVHFQKCGNLCNL
jgi:hypothetical protein